MRLTILGAGASHGTPVIGCDCETCTSPDPRNHRTRASALVEIGERAFLIDTGPELRIQALRERLKRIDAVLYTHYHADHVHGIDDLKAFNAALGGPLPCYGNEETNENLRERFSYAFVGTPWVGLIPHLVFTTVESTFELLGVPLTPIELQHGRIRSCGWRIGGLAYLTDASAIPPHSMRQLRGLDLLVLDALRERPHPTHFSISEALGVISELEPRQALLTHMNHDVEYHRVSAMLPEHVALAHDGLKLGLPDPR